MATVLTCHLIETIWSRSNAGIIHAPFIVLDHNGTQHQTEAMQAGALTVWNAKACFTYAPFSDLAIMAFDAGGRQPGSFLAEAVVDVAAMLSGGRLNASVQLVNRKGQSIGLVLFAVELNTSSRTLAAGLGIPSLTVVHASNNPDSPRRCLERCSSPESADSAAAAASGRRSPFAQAAVQQMPQRRETDCDTPSGSPSSARSVGQRLAQTFNQALSGTLRVRRTRDSGPAGSSRARPAGLGAPADACSSPAYSPLRSRRSSMLRVSPSVAASASAPPSPTQRGCSSMLGPAAGGMAGPPPLQQQQRAPAAAAAVAGSFSSWGTAAARGSRSMAASPVAGDTCWSSGEELSGSGGRHASDNSGMRRLEVRQPRRVTTPNSQPPPPPAAAAAAGPGSGGSGSVELSPLMGNRARLRLQRQQHPHQPPPLLPACIQAQGSGLIAAGCDPGSPDSVAMRGGLLPLYQHLFHHQRQQQQQQYQHGGFGCRALAPAGHAAAAADAHNALLREFAAADAAGKEAILFRELMTQQQQQHKQHTGASQLLSTLQASQQQQQQQHRDDSLQQQQQMLAALDDLDCASPLTSPARAAEAAFRACLSSSGSEASRRRSSSFGGDGRYRHYPSVPTTLSYRPVVLAALPAAAAAVAAVPAALMTEQVTRPAAVPQSPGWLRASAEAAAAAALSDDEGSRVHQVRSRLMQQQQQQRQKQLRRQAERCANATPVSAAAARMLNTQLLQRLTQREDAARRGVSSYRLSSSSSSGGGGGSSRSSSGNGSDASEPGCDVAQLHDAAPEAAAARPATPAAQSKAEPDRVAEPQSRGASSAGRLSTRSLARNEGGQPAASAAGVPVSPAAAVAPAVAAAKVPRSRWAPPVRDDAVPYALPPPSFPALAAFVEPSAPCMADGDDGGPDA